MCSSSGGYFHQSCHVSASTDINVDKLGEFFVEKAEELRAAAVVLWGPMFAWRSAALQFPRRFHWWFAASDDTFACQELCSRPATNVHPTWAGRRHARLKPSFWLRLLAGRTSENIRLRAALHIYSWLALTWFCQTLHFSMTSGDL